MHLCKISTIELAAIRENVSIISQVLQVTCIDEMGVITDLKMHFIPSKIP